MEYYVNEFKQNTKEALDHAVTGKTVIILRGKQRFAVQLIDPYGDHARELKKENAYNSIKTEQNTNKGFKVGKTDVPGGHVTVPEEETKTAGLPPCCSKSQPCKHWIYNGQEENWVNTISGEIREVA